MASGRSTSRSNLARSSAFSVPTVPANLQQSGRCLAFCVRHSGHATILGMDCTTESVEIHKRLGNLPSEFNLEDRMTGLQMLQFFADLRGIDRDVPYAHELAERLQADLNRPMRRLSRGNKQKIGIIQALFHRPEVIILDEPTSGLDPLMQEEFLQILRETKEAGQTIFFSSHILTEIERVADRVGIIRSGEMVAIEDPATLTTRAFRYVRIQFSTELTSEIRQQFEAIPGTSDFDQSGFVLSFKAAGAIARGGPVGRDFRDRGHGYRAAATRGNLHDLLRRWPVMNSTRRRPTFLTYTWFQFRAELRTTIFWTIGLSIYAGLIVAIYPAVRNATNIDAIPENMRAAFNITDFAFLAGFLSSQLFGVILPLVLPFYGMAMLSNVVAGAEERGRLDILLGNPIPRYQVILGTFLVAATYLFAMVMVFGGVIWTVAAILDLELTIRQALQATFTLWPTALIFGTLALAISTFARQRSVALGIPAAVVLLSYLFLVIGRLAPAVEFIRYTSAYNYYGVAIVQGIWWGGMGILAAGIAILLTLAVWGFNRRDVFA